MDDHRTFSEMRLVAKIVSSYVKHHTVGSAELAGLIALVHRSLGGLGKTAAPASRLPAVPVRRSVQREYVVCLECGLRGKTIRRHIQVPHGLTLVEYRARWDLPHSHPVVAPAYSEQRSATAKRLGLGRGRQRPSRT
jgi:predicted transcriptional regulator